MPAMTGTDRRLLRRLPAFSPVAVRLLAVMAEERTSFKDIAQVISFDPLLAAEVLRLANSGLYGRRFEVRSILHAIAMLGFGKLSQIAFTAALWRGLKHRQTPFVREWWRHSIAAALIARQCGRDVSADAAYTAALLHGVGQLALFEEAPLEYPVLVEGAYREHADLLVRESDAYGADHATLAGLFLEQWGLPEDLRVAVSKHHEDLAGVPLVAAVQTACLGAEVAGFGRCGCHLRLEGGVPEAIIKLLTEEFAMDALLAGVNEIECSLG